MKNFKLKELAVTFSIIALTACVGIDEEIDDSGSPSNSGDPVVGQPIVDPVDPVDPGNPVVTPGPETPVTPPGDNPLIDSEFAFQIIDDEEVVVTELEDGDVIDLSSLPDLFHIEAVSSATFNSVSFQAYGPNYILNRIEESPVWTVNSSKKGFDGGEGTFTLFARGYSLDGASGDASNMSSITITFGEGGDSAAPPVAETPPPIVDDGSLVTTEVTLQWDRPELYTTGEPLDESDIAGYEILYRGAGEISYKRTYIDGWNSLDAGITLSGSGEFEFSIASIDTSGLYSVFSEPVIITL